MTDLPAGVKIRRLMRKDISQARTLAQVTWSDQVLKDTGKTIEYPLRMAKLLEAYLGTEPRGGIMAFKGDELIGSAYAHTWGKVGWTGPLEVHPEWQGKGIGTALMKAADRYLVRKGCEVIGVETMGDHDRHISFYKDLGYSISTPAFFYEKWLKGGDLSSGETQLLPLEGTTSILERAGQISGRIVPGMDLSGELWMSYVGNLGRIIVYQDPDDKERLWGISLVYGRTMEGMDNHLLRLLIVDPTCGRQKEVFTALLHDSGILAHKMGATRLFFSCSVNQALVSELSSGGYRIIGNNVRLISKGTYREAGDYQLISWAG
jgi:GNAT superfamily N-acetyltransferase